jgi:hypothetical protein
VVELAVVAFGIVLDRDLPVAGVRDLDPQGGVKPLEIRHERSQLALCLRVPLGHWPRVRVEVDEHEAREDLGPDFGLRRGIYVLPNVRRFVSAVHTKADFDVALAALDQACRALD